ncbi:PAS domain-containing protein [Spirochaetia bacterium 38H-sp]|uniref:PAS domain-containing protein n=1 Tax=Rarispira pelagica TaxID=3141764 RepID=A0ABU9UBQ0_9SPIR
MEGLFYHIFESVPVPVVFVDTSHVIRYVNRAARDKYAKPDRSLVGRSIFDCHSEASCEIIKRCYERLVAGEDVVSMRINKKADVVFLVAVRDDAGRLLGYYEYPDDPA